MLREIIKKFYILFEAIIEAIYVPIDRRNIKRSLGIKWIPYRRDRWGGKISYSEWAHVIGLFQGLIFQNIERSQVPRILDVGCGKGLLGISSLPYLSKGGVYTGLDVMKSNIDFCSSYFNATKSMEFVHLDANNPAYSPGQKSNNVNYPLESNSYDLVTALSVWTHLAETDAKFYFKEVSRVLKKGGRFIMTCWYLNEDYKESSLRDKEVSDYNGGTPKDKIFSKKAYDSKAWLTLDWVDYPEQVCGITMEGMQELLDESGMKIKNYYPGNWKEMSGMYYQDIVIFEKQ